MKRFGIILFFTCLTNSPSWAATKLIDFRLTYPLLQFQENSSYSIRQKNYAGVDLDYQFYFLNVLGWKGELTTSIVPLKDNETHRLFYSFGFLTGPAWRPLSQNYFDPQVSFLGGIAWMDIGSAMEAKWNTPLGGRVSLTLFKDKKKYGDETLALVVGSRALYYPQILSLLNPWMMDISLSLRGSF